jgi:hypothetical protein
MARMASRVSMRPPPGAQQSALKRRRQQETLAAGGSPAFAIGRSLVSHNQVQAVHEQTLRRGVKILIFWTLLAREPLAPSQVNDCS